MDIIDPNDVERIGNDLDQVARKYSNGAQQLDQHVVTLDHTVAYLLSGGFQQWKGLSSEAFQGAWQERKARIQQASLLMILSAGHLRQFVRILEEQLPALRADKSIQSSSVFNTLSASAQSSIQNEESQAQNSILMAIVALNLQLEQLAEEISDCPQDDQTEPYAGFGDNINKSDTGTGEEPPEQNVYENPINPDDTSTSENMPPGLKNDLGEYWLAKIEELGKQSGVDIEVRWNNEAQKKLEEDSSDLGSPTLGLTNTIVDANGNLKITIDLSPDANPAVAYEEYLHAEQSISDGPTALAQEDLYEQTLIEEIKVEYQVLHDASKLDMSKAYFLKLSATRQGYIYELRILYEEEGKPWPPEDIIAFFDDPPMPKFRKGQ